MPEPLSALISEKSDAAKPKADTSSALRLEALDLGKAPGLAGELPHLGSPPVGRVSSVDMQQEINQRALVSLTSQTAARDAEAQRLMVPHDPNRHSYLGYMVRAPFTLATSNETFLKEVEHYGSGFLKTAGLFAKGKYAVIATGITYALDSASPQDTLGEQAVDLSTGALKGLGMKAIFKGMESMRMPYTKAELPIALKGVLLGTSSRALEVGLNRRAFLDTETGAYSRSLGGQRWWNQVSDGRALASDIVVFTLAHASLHKLDSGLDGKILKSPALKVYATGATFGLSSGAVGELNRQRDAGEKMSFENFGKVVLRSLLQGTTDMAAASFGAYQVDQAMRARVNDTVFNARSTWLGSKANGSLLSGASPEVSLSTATVGAPEPVLSAAQTAKSPELVLARQGEMNSSARAGESTVVPPAERPVGVELAIQLVEKPSAQPAETVRINPERTEPAVRTVPAEKPTSHNYSPVPEYDPVANLVRLESSEPGTKSFSEPTGATGRFTSWSDFVENGMKEGAPRPVRVLRFSGSQAEVVVLESDIPLFEQVRALRAEIKSLEGASEQSQVQRRAQLEGELTRHRYGQRALPEDVLAFLDRLPGSNSRVYLLPGEGNAENAWHKQQYRPDYRADASRNPDGSLSLYEVNRPGTPGAPNLQEVLNHEYAHGLRHRSPVHRWMQEQALLLPQGKTTRTYAEVSPSERWAVETGEDLMAPDVATSLAFARRSPVLACVQALSLAAELRSIPAGKRGLMHAVYEQRMATVLDYAAPEARRQLIERTNGSDAGQQRAALRLLLHLGAPADLALLKPLSHVDLSHSPLPEGGLGKLSALPGVTSVDLTGTLANRATLESLASVPGLKKVYLHETRVTDADLSALHGLQLQDLGLRGTGITDAGLRHLEGMPLQRLSLQDTQVTDFGVVSLKGLSQLNNLNLAGTRIGPASLGKLAEIKTLKQLNVSRTRAANNALSIQGRLPGCKIEK